MVPRILCDTKEMSRERWLESREHGPDGSIPVTIGGSDIATVLGVNPYVAPLDFWLYKKGVKPLPEPDQASLMRMKIGTVMEPLIAEMYENETGNCVIGDTNLYQHAKYDFALANLDYRFEEYGGITGPLECKNTNYFNADSWKDGNVPLHYEMQVRWQMAIMDAEVADLSAFWGTGLATPRVFRDLKIEQMIFEKALAFIESLKEDEPPNILGINSELALKALASYYAGKTKNDPTIEFGRKYEKELRQIAELQALASAADAESRRLNKELDKLTAPIADVMREHTHGVLQLNDETIEIRYVPKTQMRVQNAFLKEQYPEAYKASLGPTISRKVKVTVVPQEETLPKAS